MRLLILLESHKEYENEMKNVYFKHTGVWHNILVTWFK